MPKLPEIFFAAFCFCSLPGSRSGEAGSPKSFRLGNVSQVNKCVSVSTRQFLGRVPAVGRSSFAFPHNDDRVAGFERRPFGWPALPIFAPLAGELVQFRLVEKDAIYGFIQCQTGAVFRNVLDDAALRVG